MEERLCIRVTQLTLSSGLQAALLNHSFSRSDPTFPLIAAMKTACCLSHYQLMDFYSIHLGYDECTLKTHQLDWRLLSSLKGKGLISEVGHRCGELRLELCPTVGLTETPVARSNIVGDYSAPITCCDLEGQGLTIEVYVALPVLAPVAGHGLPARVRALDGDGQDITSTANIGKKDNSSAVSSYVLENRLRKIKVLQGSVTPPACIVWESTVWRAEISGRDYDRTRETPLAVIYTSDLKTSTTSQPIVEQSSTKRGCACAEEDGFQEEQGEKEARWNVTAFIDAFRKLRLHDGLRFYMALELLFTVFTHKNKS
ncbi:hypothetical protein RJ639_010834 [Escallonia herrerae]|uniref:Uncharacterized protein n=1 Tax=Escallonia herrerae TaxID=1293975 RepID=A0AA88VUA9_9ASTE|nr:hypothetical protein RJ639_010834 [Escallonia herrerae]